MKTSRIGSIGRTGETESKQLPLSKIRPAPRRGLSRVDAAMYIGVSPSKFDELRKGGRVSPPRLIDGRKVWDVIELDRDFETFPVEGGNLADDEDWNTAL
jgi:hypothetical protein